MLLAVSAWTQLASRAVQPPERAMTAQALYRWRTTDSLDDNIDVAGVFAYKSTDAHTDNDQVLLSAASLECDDNREDVSETRKALMSIVHMECG